MFPRIIKKFLLTKGTWIAVIICILFIYVHHSDYENSDWNPQRQLINILNQNQSNLWQDLKNRSKWNNFINAESNQNRHTVGLSNQQDDRSALIDKEDTEDDKLYAKYDDDNDSEVDDDNDVIDVNNSDEIHIGLNDNTQENGIIEQFRSIPRNLNSTVILDLPKIKFLSNYRNPCWLEPLPSNNPYTNNRYGGKTSGYMSNLSPAWNQLYAKAQRTGQQERLRCLPYFFIGGFPKCGTTDVYDKLIQHPLIVPCLFKEPHYWTRWRFWTDKCFWHQFLCDNGESCLSDTARCDGRKHCSDGSDEIGCDRPHHCTISNGGCSHLCSMTTGKPICSCPRGYQLKRDLKTCVGGTPLQDYTALFDVSAEEIRSFIQHKDFGQGTVAYHPQVTGEATPATFWDNHRWHDEPSNDNSTNEPATLTANIITHLLPDVKNIVMVRNPTRRLYSDMLYFNPHATPEHFHRKVKEGVDWFNNCMKNYTVRSCVYQPMDRERPPEGRYWHPVERLRIGMYSQYLKDWLKLVPANQILVVRLEDYSENRADVLNNITQFLQLEPMPSHYMFKWESTAHKNSGSHKYASQGQMLPETADMLDEFYKPFNEELAVILKDNKYLYDSPS